MRWRYGEVGWLKLSGKTSENIKHAYVWYHFRPSTQLRGVKTIGSLPKRCQFGVWFSKTFQEIVENDIDLQRLTKMKKNMEWDLSGTEILNWMCRGTVARLIGWYWRVRNCVCLNTSFEQQLFELRKCISTSGLFFLLPE